MKTVWTFTNKRELDKNQFIDYFERKVFRTIRKYDILPEDKIFRLKNDGGLNSNILKKVLTKKFEVEDSDSFNVSSDNLSQVAEDIFRNILNGRYNGSTPNSRPLYFLSDKEIELYADLNCIVGNKRKIDKKIQKFLEKFIDKNQDTEINIVKAFSQIV